MSSPTHTRVWCHGKLDDEDFPLERISDNLEREDCVVWADVLGADEATLRAIGEELGIDQHALEDALDRFERPKLDHYQSHLFLNTYALSLDRESAALRTGKVAAFVTDRALITIRDSDLVRAADITQRWDDSPELAGFGVVGLLQGLLDLVVDGHFDAVQVLDDEIESLEDLLFDNRPRSQEVQRRTYALRKSLVQLRRVVLPMREVVNSMLRRDYQGMTPELLPYYQDVYDHVLRAGEWTESLRDMVSTVFETNLSLQDARLNNVMKKLTSWAAIIAVPTAVTGYFGQNIPYPGFSQRWGFWLSSVVIVVMAGGLYAGFRKRGWL